VPGGAVISVVSALGGWVYDRFEPRPLAIRSSARWTKAAECGRIWQPTSPCPAQAMMWAPMTTIAPSALRALATRTEVRRSTVSACRRAKTIPTTALDEVLDELNSVERSL